MVKVINTFHRFGERCAGSFLNRNVFVINLLGGLCGGVEMGQKMTVSGSFSSARVNREGAVHCARGGRAPLSIG